MKLCDLLKNVKIDDSNISLDEDISDIVCDSRKCTKGCAFICLEGTKFDGHLYIDEAVKLGAKVLITQRDVSFSGSEKFVRIDGGRKAIARMACNFFEDPSKKIKLIGVTGTKGKTTTTYMIKSILEAHGEKVGIIGTIESKIGDNQLAVSSNTTPDAIELQRLFSKMVDYGADVIVMEVSSHSLDLDRVFGSDFDIAVFTNLSQDHLDYHKNFENYFQAKKLLFSMCKKAIINIDDSYGKRLFGEISCNKKSFSIDENSDIKANDFKVTANGVTFLNNGEMFDVKIPGKFSIYNALAGIGIGYEFGCFAAEIQEGFDNLVVPGRSELVDIDSDFAVMVDYAHSPDSLKNILLATKEYAKGRIICVFGCGGDRDKTKRPIMGEIAGSLSDIVVVTSDNPRSEDPETIISEIEKGIKATNKEYFRVPDRAEAIYKALSVAKKDDIIVIAGKGHETYQILREKTIHFDDKEQVKIQYGRLKSNI